MNSTGFSLAVSRAGIDFPNFWDIEFNILGIGEAYILNTTVTTRDSERWSDYM